MWRSASRWGALGLLLILMAYSGDMGSIGQQPPPSPAPIAPNASLIVANALKYSIWHPKLLGIQPEIILYSLVLEVLSSEPVSPELLNLVKPGDVIEAFSKEVLAPELFGQKIKATVRLAGDERGQRFWIKEISVIK